MALVIEDGSGVAQANGYASLSYILNYLTERNRQTENSWSTATTAIQEAHAIAATDYIEGRWRECFKGVKEFRNLTLAKAVLTLTDNPLAGAVVVVGSQTYTFVAALALADDVLIDTNTSLSINNLIDAINANPETIGTKFGTGTVENVDASARAFEDDTMIAEAKVDGLAGNLIVSTTDVVGATWSSATLLGGTDTGKPQPLSFPRTNLFDRDGIRVVGIPDRLEQAVSEYAVRSLGSTLQPDPAVTTGRAVVELTEKVDVITESTKWQEGGVIQISVPYPAADSLIREYIRGTGLVMRA